MAVEHDPVGSLLGDNVDDNAHDLAAVGEAEHDAVVPQRGLLEHVEDATRTDIGSMDGSHALLDGDRRRLLERPVDHAVALRELDELLALLGGRVGVERKR